MKPIVLILILCVAGPAFSYGQKKRPDNTSTTYVKVVAQSNGELTAKGITQDRDLSKYVSGGHFDCRYWTKSEQRKTCDEKGLRDFIWRMWNEKSRAYVRTTADSVDAVSTAHIFIEPDRNGKWSIIWRIARWHALPGGSDQITNLEKIVSVEQLGATSNDGWSLSMKNEAGEVINQIPWK